MVHGSVHASWVCKDGLVLRQKVLDFAHTARREDEDGSLVNTLHLRQIRRLPTQMRCQANVKLAVVCIHIPTKPFHVVQAGILSPLLACHSESHARPKVSKRIATSA